MPTTRVMRAFAVTAAVALPMAACSGRGGSGGDGAVPPPPAPTTTTRAPSGGGGGGVPANPKFSSSAKQATATVGGHTWDVYSGSNGANKVFSFLRQGGTNAGTVDVKAVLDWIKGRGWFGDVTVREVQFGFEITSSAGGMNFVSTDHAVTAS